MICIMFKDREQQIESTYGTRTSQRFSLRIKGLGAQPATPVLNGDHHQSSLEICPRTISDISYRGIPVLYPYMDEGPTDLRNASCLYTIYFSDWTR